MGSKLRRLGPGSSVSESCLTFMNLSQGTSFLVVVIWLILPVVICLSQRLSHACVSTNLYMVKLRMAH